MKSFFFLYLLLDEGEIYQTVQTILIPHSIFLTRLAQFSHTPADLVLDAIHFSRIINHTFSLTITLTSKYHTALHKVGKGRVVVSATHMTCKFDLSPKRKGTIILGQAEKNCRP